METVRNGKYPQKWQDRFTFFDAHGAPSTPAFKEALKAAPGNTQRTIRFNWLAFFFGPIYFFILGLWRKALVGIGLTLVLLVVDAILMGVLGPDSGLARGLSRGLGIALSLLYGLLANYAYYLKEIKERDSWNIFEGLR
jgi:asparagine N-glycosylation enzyme membrane subunit Stt3